MKNFDIKDFIRFCLSCTVYLIVATLFGEYVVSRSVDASLQITAWVVMLVYTVFQIRSVFRYMFNLINF